MFWPFFYAFDPFNFLGLRPFESVSVRPLEPDDAPALAELHAEGFGRAWSEDEFDRLLGQSTVLGVIAHIERPSLYGLMERSPAGFVIVRRAADEAEILSIAVRRSSRRSGIGGRLLDALLRMLYTERVQSLFLEVDSANESALALYRKFAFQRVGVRENYYRHASKAPTAAHVLRRDVWTPNADPSAGARSTTTTPRGNERTG